MVVASRSPTLTVLLVDDNEEGRVALARLLQDNGFAVNEAADGRDALRQVSGEPDLVVLYHGWNDLKLFAELSPERSLLRRLRPPPREEGSDLVWNPFVRASGPLDRALFRSSLYVRLRRRWLEWRLGLRGPEGLLRSDPAAAAVDSELSRRATPRACPPSADASRDAARTRTSGSPARGRRARPASRPCGSPGPSPRRRPSPGIPHSLRSAAPEAPSP